MPSRRALVGARTSSFNEDKTSHHAQRESGDRYAESNDMTVVGHFEDLGVSATVSPWEREDLGPWLSRERQDEYDVIVWSKVDRAFRSSKDCADVAHWAEQHGKALVFTDDGITLDYAANEGSMALMMAKFFLTIASLFGEMELARMVERARDTQRFLRTTDRWPGGVAPLGFRTVDHPSGHGKALETDPHERDILYRMAGLLLEGRSFNEIARDLNDAGVLSSIGRARKSTERPAWSAQNIVNALTLPRTQGVKTHRGQPVLDSQGEPVRIGPPTFDPDMWNRIQDAVRKRQHAGQRRATSNNPVLGVGFCECGASLTVKASTVKGRQYSYYRCGRTPNACPGVSMKTAKAHDVLGRLMTETIGGMKATRSVFVPGSDNSADVETVNASITRLRRESDMGLIDDEDEYFTRMSALTARKRDLESTPVRAAGWETVEEDETYAEKFAAADGEGRREILRDAGIRLTLHADGEPTVTAPGTAGELLFEVFGTEDVPLSRLTGNRATVGVFRAHAREDIS